MNIVVNGMNVELEREMSISELLRIRCMDRPLVAVEHNLRWITRDEWPNVVLKDSDRLEIVRILAGG